MNQEMELNEGIRIDRDLDTYDLKKITASINEVKQRISSALDVVKRSPEIVAFIADQKRAQEQEMVNVKRKDGKLQILQDKIGLGFNNNSDHQKAINLIYDFNEAKDSVISQLSDEKEIKARECCLIDRRMAY